MELTNHGHFQVILQGEFPIEYSIGNCEISSLTQFAGIKASYLQDRFIWAVADRFGLEDDNSVCITRRK